MGIEMKGFGERVTDHFAGRMREALDAREAWRTEVLLAPHKAPSSFPTGSCAIYIFMWGDVCLKVGMAGSQSAARFTSQHYSPGSSSANLAKSLLSKENAAMTSALGIPLLDKNGVRKWLLENTTRVHVFLPVEHEWLLPSLEAVAINVLKPVFEKGKRCQ